MKKIAVILSGCGYLDGAEIREAVLTYFNLDKYLNKITYTSFAPNKNQHHVVNHLLGTEAIDKRNILEESARITRGKVQDLEDLKVEEFDGLLMPGGFGVAKNLSEFAFKGGAGEIDSKLTQIITNFHEANKPIGLICISPAIAGTILKEHNPKVTIGNDLETINVLEGLGVKHQECKASEVCFDERNNLFSTPAYMYDDENLVNINEGISKLIENLIQKL